MGIFLNQLIQFYLNNTINIRHLTQRIMSCYTHKMAIASWPYLCDVISPYAYSRSCGVPPTVPVHLYELGGTGTLKGKKVKFSHTRYRALGPELIPVYRQSARR